MRNAGQRGLRAFGGRLMGFVSERAAVRENRAVGTLPGYSVERSGSVEALYAVAMVGRAVAGSSAGARVSFVRVLRGMESPYLIRHRRDEVVYIVTGGRGQFLVDGEVVDAAAGTVVRVSPEAHRAWRNVSTDDFCLIVVQSRPRKATGSGRTDAVGLASPLRWPR